MIASTCLCAPSCSPPLPRLNTGFLRRFVRLVTVTLLLVLAASPAQAGENATELVLNLNTVWVVIASALVFFMQAGFALLESGMARSKNAVNVMMKNYLDMCFGALAFWFIGYGLMFGDNSSGWVGTSMFALSGAEDWDYTVLLFQTMFAATAVTIASGAMAERTRFGGYLVASLIVTGLIYPVYGAWVWNANGWLASMGFIDFAGSTVVHSIGGWVALAGVIVVGPRLGRFGNDGSVREISGHNLGMVGLGGFILWMGWVGFNGGSTLAAEAGIGKIVLNTHLAAAAGAVGAIFTMLVAGRPVLLTQSINGSLAGLVSITAGCATMDPPFAVLTGFIGGVIAIAWSAVMRKRRLDDVVDAVAVHGMGGVWGTLAAGLFISGNLFDMDQVAVQLLGVTVAFLWAFPLAWLLYSVIAAVMGLRSDTIDQQRGLDFTEHSEIGYPEFQQSALHNSDHR